MQKTKKVQVPKKSQGEPKPIKAKRRPERKASSAKENVRHIQAKEPVKKKKEDPRRLARLKEIQERRARAERWRRRYEQSVAQEEKRAKGEPKPAERPAVRQEAPQREARAETRPRVGYLGEGGGDGQGGGSIGGGSGGAARTDMERYYGLLSERVRNNWTVPLNLSDVSNLRTEVIVDISREGEARGLQIQRSSGNRVYDEAALRAVAKSVQPKAPAPPNTVKDSWLPLGFRFCGKGFCR